MSTMRMLTRKQAAGLAAILLACTIAIAAACPAKAAGDPDGTTSGDVYTDAGGMFSCHQTMRADAMVDNALFGVLVTLGAIFFGM